MNLSPKSEVRSLEFPVGAERARPGYGIVGAEHARPAPSSGRKNVDPAQRESQEHPQRKAPRLEKYDYGQPGAYFITVVSENRSNLFGSIENGIFHGNRFAELLLAIWQEQPNRFAGLKLDAFVVMPNHFHAIVWLLPPLPRNSGSEYSSEQVKVASIPKLMQGFKAAYTRQANMLRDSPGKPVLQRSYHDHIVRDDLDLNRIREYIYCNPLRWHLDKENPQRDGLDEFHTWFEACRALDASGFASFGGGEP